MRKIYLTIGIDVNDSFFSFFSNFKKANIGELISEASLKKGELFPNKIDLIIEYIKGCQENILIGFAINSIEKYDELKGRLYETGDNISKVFIKKNDTLRSYEDMYKDHSRWLDYSPKFIEIKNQEYNEELVKLINRMQEGGINIEFISSPKSTA